jgi:hypothetical protein
MLAASRAQAKPASAVVSLSAVFIFHPSSRNRGDGKSSDARPELFNRSNLIYSKLRRS